MIIKPNAVEVIKHNHYQLKWFRCWKKWDMNLMKTSQKHILLDFKNPPNCDVFNFIKVLYSPGILQKMLIVVYKNHYGNVNFKSKLAPVQWDPIKRLKRSNWIIT